MADFETPAEGSRLLKILYLGDSGTGKTGSLCSLAAGGYNLRILDLDNGVEVMRDYLTSKQSPYLNARAGLWTAEQAKDIRKRVKYKVITETVKMLPGEKGTGMLSPIGDAWIKIQNQLQDWKSDGLGNVGEWTSQDVLVIDSLTALSKAAWYYHLGMNGRLFGRAEQSDYFFAQEHIYKFLTYLHTPIVPCHVVVICHIDYIEREGDKLLRGFPNTVGKALSPQIPREWNHMIRAMTTGQGQLATRKIVTTTTGVVDLKSAAPLRVKPEYELTTGLLEYFRDALSSPPVQSPKPSVDPILSNIANRPAGGAAM